MGIGDKIRLPVTMGGREGILSYEMMSGVVIGLYEHFYRVEFIVNGHAIRESYHYEGWL